MQILRNFQKNGQILSKYFFFKEDFKIFKKKCEVIHKGIVEENLDDIEKAISKEISEYISILAFLAFKQYILFHIQ